VFIFVLTTGAIVLVAAGVGMLLQRLVYVPLKDLNLGAQKISGGDLDHRLPVRSSTSSAGWRSRSITWARP